MSHATHVGFSAPPITALRGVVSLFSWDGPPLFFASCVVGVGSLFRISTWALSFGSPRLFHLPFALLTESSATGVCHNPDSLSDMWGAKVVCSQHAPLRIEPHRGQVSENSVKPPRSEYW